MGLQIFGYTARLGEKQDRHSSDTSAKRHLFEKTKTTSDHKWKKDLIVSIKALKMSYGGRDPVTSGEDALEIDKIGSRFEELLYLSEDESEQEEEL